jgi:hypothetical protein
VDYFGIASADLDDRPDHRVKHGRRRFVDGLLARDKAADFQVAASDRRDHDLPAGEQEFGRVDSLLVAEDHNLREPRTGDMHERIAGRGDHVIAELLAEHFAFRRRVAGVAQSNRPECAVARFHTFDMQQVVEPVERFGVGDGREGGQRVPAERRVGFGRVGQGRRTRGIVEIGQRLGRVELDLGIVRREPLLKQSERLGADRFQLERGLGRGGRIFELLPEQLQPIDPLDGRFSQADIPHDAEVTGQIVLVARRNGEIDEVVAFRDGDTFFDARLEGVETTIDRVADQCARADRGAIFGNGQTQRPIDPRLAAPQDAGPQLVNLVGIPLEDRVDEQVSFGQSVDIARVNRTAGKLHLPHAGQHQPAAAEAGRFAPAGNPHQNVEPFLLPHSGRQAGGAQHEARCRRSQDLFGLGHLAGHHFGDQPLAGLARRRIAAGASQVGDQGDRLQRDPVESHGAGVVADRFGALNFPRQLVIGRLSPHERRRTAGKQSRRERSHTTSEAGCQERSAANGSVGRLRHHAW